jgi:hypothetical protein
MFQQDGGLFDLCESRPALGSRFTLRAVTRGRGGLKPWRGCILDR